MMPTSAHALLLSTMCLTFLLAVTLPTDALAQSAKAPPTVNLSAANQGAIPTASDSVDSYKHLPGNFADQKPETAWFTHAGYTDHWAEIRWRNRAIRVVGMEADFTSSELTYQPEKPFLDEVAPAPVKHVSVRPTDLTLSGQVAGKWQEIPLTNLQWKGDVASVKFEPPVEHVTELRLSFKTPGDGKVASLREWAVTGPDLATGYNHKPKWTSAWIWGELGPLIANAGFVNRYFRKTFEVADPAQVTEAALQLAIYDSGTVYLNGEEVAVFEAGPYAVKPKPQLHEIDPSKLRKGKNLLAVRARDEEGWGNRGVLVELHLRKADGTVQTIAGDRTFHSATFVIDGWNRDLEARGTWILANPLTSPNQRFPNLYGLDYYPPFTSDSVELTGVNVTPAEPKAGEPYTLTFSFRIPQTLKESYAVVADLGIPGRRTWENYIDLSYGDLFSEENALAKGSSGEKQVTIQGVWPNGTPPHVRMLLRVCSPKAEAKLASAASVGAVPFEHGLDLSIGRPMAAPAQKGFSDNKMNPDGTLSINGKRVAPIMLTSSFQTPDRYADWLTSGVEIFRIAPQSTLHTAFPRGESARHHKVLLDEIRRQVETFHATNPNARFLLMMQLDPPNRWVLDHPEELIVSPDGDQYALQGFRKDSQDGFKHNTPNSPAFLEMMRQGVHDFVKEMEQQSFAPSILGFVLVHGRAGENYWGGADFQLQTDIKTNRTDLLPRDRWTFGDVGVAARRHFRDWLKAKYKTKENLQKAWKMPDVDFEDLISTAKWPGQRFSEILMWRSRPNDRFIFRDRAQEGSFYYDFVRHHNEANAQCFLTGAEAIKKASDNRLIVGGFIGYVLPGITNSTPALAQHSGHLAYAEILESPYFDFTCSPNFYHFRRAGSPIMPMGVGDSLRLHGKIWLHEYDTRTYRSPITPKTFSVEETLEVTQRDFAFAITKDQGWWWLEFPFASVGERAASWFSDKDLLADMSTMKKVYERYLTLDRKHEPNAECAIIFNVEQAYHTDPDAPAATVGSAVTNYLIPKLFSLGPSFDIYAQTDLPLLVEKGWAQKYKMILFVNSYQFTAAERELIETKLKKDGRTLLFFFAPGYVNPEATDTERSVAGIEQVTGMTGVKRLAQKQQLGVNTPTLAKPYDVRSWWGEPQISRMGYEIGPVFYLDQSAANGWEPVGTLRINGRDDAAKVALARLKKPDHQVYYSVLPDLPLELLREILQTTGVHLYTPTPGIYTWSNDQFLAVHTGKEAKGLELTLPSPATWVEPFEAKVYGTDAKSIKVDLKAGETKFFCLDRDGTWKPFATK